MLRRLRESIKQIKSLKPRLHVPVNVITVQKQAPHLIFSLITGVILIYICSIGIQNVFRYNSFASEYQALTDKLVIETRKNIILKQQLIKLDDLSHWEYLAKTRLGYVKANEKVYKPKKSI